MELKEILLNWDKTAFDLNSTDIDPFLTREVVEVVFTEIGLPIPADGRYLWHGWVLLRPRIELILKAPTLTEVLLVLRNPDIILKNKVTEFYEKVRRIIKEEGIIIK